jgi:alpha-beta hydrolase superfamily lysophospholipase
MIKFNHRLAFNRKTIIAGSIVAIIVVLQGCSGPQQKPWHTEKLTEEFTEAKTDEVKSFADYLQLEARLFKQLDEKVYAQSATGPEYNLDRYSPGSAADPRKQKPDWNHSFEFTADKPRGAVLLLHGMSDSPYSLRKLGQTLNQNQYWVVGLRMPGHGTAPSGLRYIDHEDMAAAVRLAMAHLGSKVKNQPVHVIGYSTGASLALEYTLNALEGRAAPVPASLILISPAIGIHPVAAFAGFKNWLSNLPGLDGLAYLHVQPEFDPYKYNSFATNASTVVHRVTRSVASRIRTRASRNPEIVLPPVLVFKSTVDATVTTEAVVDNLLNHLKPHRHELVLFDINRFAAVKSRLLINDPAPLTDRVMNDDTLPFAVTLITNKNSKTTQVVSKHMQPFGVRQANSKQLHLAWPPGVISLSHVALPFSPDDPLYGQRSPENEDFIFLGQMAIQGERGLLILSSDWMLRLRYNPFYKILESHTLEWVNNAGRALNK